MHDVVGMRNLKLITYILFLLKMIIIKHQIKYPQQLLIIKLI